MNALIGSAALLEGNLACRAVVEVAEDGKPSG